MLLYITLTSSIEVIYRPLFNQAPVIQESIVVLGLTKGQMLTIIMNVSTFEDSTQCHDWSNILILGGIGFLFIVEDDEGSCPKVHLAFTMEQP